MIGVALLLLSGGCSTPVSAEARECIAHWNDSGPRGIVAEEGYVLAELTAGENKAGQGECGFLFHAGEGEPWRVYGIIVEGGAALGTWSSQAGSAWGTDSPEGEIVATVHVRTDGGLDQG
jgi:hypothetical protein